MKMNLTNLTLTKMTTSQLAQIIGYQQQSFIVYGHNVTANYTFFVPKQTKTRQNRPKISTVLPQFWLKKASNLLYFRFKTRQNRPKTRRKSSILNPLGTV